MSCHQTLPFPSIFYTPHTSKSFANHLSVLTPEDHAIIVLRCLTRSSFFYLSFPIQTSLSRYVSRVQYESLQLQLYPIGCIMVALQNSRHALFNFSTRLHLKIAQCNPLHKTSRTVALITRQLTRMPADYKRQPSQTSKMAAYYTFEDYSGTSTPNTSDNPYDGLIENCKNDPVRTRFSFLPASYSNIRSTKSKPPTTTIGPTATRSKSRNCCPPTSPASQSTRSSRISKILVN